MIPPRMAVHRSGQGPHLVLFHGGMGSWKHWIRNVEPLAARFTVHALDHPSYGASAPVPRETTGPAYLDLVHELFLEMLPGGAPLRLAGFSFGGAIAANLARRLGPRVTHLCLVSPGGFPMRRFGERPIRSYREAGGDERLFREICRHNLLVNMLSDPAGVTAEAVDIQADGVRRTRFDSRKVSGGGTLLAVELSRFAFAPNHPTALPAGEVERRARAGGVPVACVGVELGWLWADGEERRRLLDTFAERCRVAVALGCHLMMSPVDSGTGDVRRAAASVREVGDIAAGHGARLAVEFNSQAAQFSSLGPLREVISAAGHPACGLLLDTYHLGRSGATLEQVDDLALGEIAYVQFSDVPPSGLRPGYVLDRLPPGQGTFPFRDFFAPVRTKGYTGAMAYEAPNEQAWKRPSEGVAREALAATRALV